MELVPHVTGLLSGNISFFLPRTLATLCESTGLAAEELLQKHTVFPFATAFMPSPMVEEFQELFKATVESRNTAAFVRTIYPNTGRYVFCPNCLITDRHTYGETYWHRLHFLPGVSHCPLHSCNLLYLPSRYTGTLLIRPPPSSNDIAAARSVPPLTTNLAFQRIFTERALQTLSSHWTHKDEWHSVYKEMAIEKGYTLRGGIVGKRIAIDLRLMLTAETLKSLNCLYVGKLSSSWPAHLVRPYARHLSRFSPVQHLLLYAFLSTKTPLEQKIVYINRGRASQEYAKVDDQLARHVQTRWQMAKNRNERVTVKSILKGVPMSSTFYNHRHLFPLTVATLEEFRRSNQAWCQTGKRPKASKKFNT